MLVQEKGKGRHRPSGSVEHRRAKRIDSSPEQGNDSEAERSPVRNKAKVVKFSLLLNSFISWG